MNSATLFAVAIGGALGSMARFLAGYLTVLVFGSGFPYGTLLVNVSGSFLIGIAYVLLVSDHSDVSIARSFLMIGFLGAFTTFSTFSLDTFQLIEAGEVIKATINVLLNILLCFFACWLGVVVAR